MRKSLFKYLCLLFIITNSSFKCNKEDTQMPQSNYSFEYTFDGKTYKWSGEIPIGNTSFLICTYGAYDPQLRKNPVLEIGLDTRISPYNFLIIFPEKSNTGTFQFTEKKVSNSQPSFSVFTYGLSPEYFYGETVTVTLNTISKEPLGIVSGSFSGTVVDITSPQVRKSISGNFRAWRAQF